MDIREYVIEKAKGARKSSRELSQLSSGEKNRALLKIANYLYSNRLYIIEANKKDLAAAEEKGLSKAMLDRLMLDEKRIDGMIEGLKQVSELADPVGEVISMWKAAQDIQVGQIRVPLGVIGIIYEARPNVTVDAAALCLKTGNSVILRGGSEAINTNRAVVAAITEALREVNFPENSVQLIEVPDREAVNIMLKLNKYIDVIIPRGGAGLIRTVVENSTVPVIETGVGNCHVYVDSEADFKMACDIIINAKTHRPAVCNAMETLLVNTQVAEEFLPLVSEELIKRGVELRGCQRTLKILPNIKSASEEDWSTEYLELILAVKVVDSIDDAIDHIDNYGTKHSEAIITNNYMKTRKFLNEVDAAAVYVNASTRFTDGHQFGFGAEIGISTQKLHARGPMGLKELTTIKYIVYGEGQVRK